MRTLTDAQTAAFERGVTDFATFWKIEAEGPDGTYRDYSDYLDRDWQDSWSCGLNIDQPAQQATVRLARDHFPGYSLAPLHEDSAVNRDSTGSYATAIDAGRGIRILVAVVESGRHPTDSEYVTLFDGEIDRIAWGSDPVEITARDTRMATVADRWVETITAYGSEAGVAIETVLQSVLTDHAGGLSLYSENTTGSPAFNTSDSPGFLISPESDLGEISVLQGLDLYTQLIGWVVRSRWIEAIDGFGLMFYEPDRAKTTPNYTFGPNDYRDVRQLNLDRGPIRNAISVQFVDSNGARQTITRTDATSITAYGRRWMKFIEGSDSPIDTTAEATAMADAAKSDLSLPAADQEIDLPGCWWFIEMGDLHRYTANGVHYTTDQDLAVYGVRWEGSAEGARTAIQARGKPAGMYSQWRTNRRRKPTANVPFSYSLEPTQSGSTGTLTLTLSDPTFAVTAVEFKKRTGGGNFGASWLPTWDTSTGTAGTDLTLTRAESVALAGKHTSAIKARISYDDETGAAQTKIVGHTFDLDTIAEVTSISHSLEGDGEVRLSATGDEDVANLYVRVTTDGTTPTDPTNASNDGTISGRSGSALSGKYATPGSTIKAKVVGYDSQPAAGPVQSYEVTVAAPVVKVEDKTITYAVNGSDQAIADVVLKVAGTGSESGTMTLWTDPSAATTPDPQADAADASVTMTIGQTVGDTGSAADHTTAALTDILISTLPYGVKTIYARWVGTNSGLSTGITPIVLVRTPADADDISPGTDYTVPAKPYFDANRRPAKADSFEIGGENAMRHQEQSALGKDGQAVSFGSAYSTTPTVVLLPANNARTYRSTFADDQHLRMTADSLTTSGFTPTCEVVDNSSTATTAIEDGFSSTQNTASPENGNVALSADGAVAYSNLEDANTTETQYTAWFDVDTTGIDSFNFITVELYYNDAAGSSTWTLAASRMYGSGKSLSDESLSFNGSLGADYDLRLRISYNSSPGASTGTVTAHGEDNAQPGVTYDKVTSSPSTETMTDLSSGYIYWVAQEG